MLHVLYLLRYYRFFDHFTPYSFNDCAHKIAGVEIKNERSTIIKSNKIHDRTAINNLDRLRSLKSQDANRVSIIGIQVSSASIVKEIPEDTLIETIRLINSSETMIPILLTAPTEEEKKKASRINKEFENKLVSVEADFIALPSVLKNIDLLLTPDTSIKHLADLLDHHVGEQLAAHLVQIIVASAVCDVEFDELSCPDVIHARESQRFQLMMNSTTLRVEHTGLE